MASKVIPVQLLRSEVLNKRPDPAKLLPGQGAVNTNADQPGLFFADNTSTTLFKVGPCAVGNAAPNTGATGEPGQLGNTKGELWFDTSLGAPYTPGVLKVWDGTQWLPCFPTPAIYAIPVVSDTAPDVGSYVDGTLWWNSASGLMYILYTSGTARQWVQVSPSPAS